MTNNKGKNISNKLLATTIAVVICSLAYGASHAAYAISCPAGSFCGTLYYTDESNVKSVTFQYTSPSPPVFGPVQLIYGPVLPGGADGLTFNPQNGNLLVGDIPVLPPGQVISEVDPIAKTLVTTISTSGDPAHLMVDPTGQTLFGSNGDPGNLISVALNPLGSGVTHPISGDDAAFGVDTVQWADATHAFYTSDHSHSFTGGGDVGTIDMNTFTTTCFKTAGVCNFYPGAHGMSYDPFTGDLMIFGGNHITQVDTSGNVISDLVVPGALFDQGAVDGHGHLLVADQGQGAIFFLDYSVDRQVNGPHKVTALDSVGGTDDVAPLIGPGTDPTTTVTTSSQIGNDIPGTTVTDSANVTGSGTTPLPNLTGTVNFQLCGPNPSASTTLNCVPAGAVPITASGGTATVVSQAQSPTASGSYCWTATFVPSSGSQYSGSSSTTTTNECFSVLPSTTIGNMTGGGSIVDPVVGKVTHGFELQCNTTKSPNSLEVNWGKGNKFHLDVLTSAFCVNDATISPYPPASGFDTYVGTGTGSYNGVSGATAQWTFTDAGEPGKNDQATIVIKDNSGNTVLSVSGNLQHGNQQAHS
ncbi:MAG: hypothetical protein KGI11_08085 [Thaumarchaeota archaeon]|nr:hypothetical protein [Nitrososphaerota archaeon]